MLWLLLMISATWASVLSADPYLLVACRTSIEKLSLTTGERSTFKSGLTHVSALANDYEDQLLFYSDKEWGTISKVSLKNPDEVTVIVDSDLYTVNGLAVDTEAKLIYWTDGGEARIERCDYNGGNRQVMADNLELPRGIAIGFTDILWTDSANGTIEKMNMQGERRKTLINTGTPSAIAFDSQREIVYWSDSYRDHVRIATRQGSGILVQNVFQVNGLALYGDYLFLSKLYENVVHRVNRFTGENNILVMNATLPEGMTVVQPFSFAEIARPLLRLGFHRGSHAFICTLPENEHGHIVKWISGTNILKIDHVANTKSVLLVSDIKAGSIVESKLLCSTSMRQFDNGTEFFLEEKRSAVFKAEVKLTSSRKLTLREGVQDGLVRVKFTGPPIFFGAHELALDLELEEAKDEIWTKDKRVIDQLVIAGRKDKNGRLTDKQEVHVKNWFGDHVFRAIAVPDGREDGDKQRKLVLNLQRTVMVGDVQATVVDGDKAGALCRVTNDPHFTTFAGTFYDNHFEGQFVLFKHRFEPVQINTVHSKCFWGIPGATCTCGVAVRNGRDNIIFNRCPQKGVRNGRETPIHIYYVQKGKPKTKILRDGESKYKVRLQHGGLVTISMTHRGFLYVEYKSTGKDRPFRHLILAQGLCGGNNGKKDLDLYMRNGALASLEQVKDTRYYRSDTFSKNWRVMKGTIEDLFGAVQLRVNNEVDDRENVVCVVRRNKEKHCSENFDKFKFFETEDEDLNSPKVKYRHVTKVVGARRRRKRSAADNLHFDPFAPLDIDENAEPAVASWPTPSGRTEKQATDFCRKMIVGDRATQLCSKLTTADYNSEIENCVNDVMLTDDLSWVNSTIAGIRQSCVTYKDSLDNTAPAGAAPPPLPNGVNETELMDSLCLNDCSKRGVCRGGNCKCDSGYVGADCSMKLTDPPEVKSVMYGNLCDIDEMSCDGAFIFGDKFHDRATLTCHLQKYQVGTPLPDVNSNVVKVSARYVMKDQVFCPIPHGEPHLIRISNDGQHPHHKRLFYFSHNSTCVDCEMGDTIIDTTCFRQPRTCLIGDLCVMDGTPHPSQSQLVCDSSIDNKAWSRKE